MVNLRLLSFCNFICIYRIIYFQYVFIFDKYLGQTFKFICGRWLGQNVDDGSTERYMVGYPALSPSSLEKELTSANELSFSSDTSSQSSNTQDLIQLVQECSNNPPETTCPPMQLKVALVYSDQLFTFSIRVIQV